MQTVLVDAENTRRSVWPNINPDEFVRRCCAWSAANGHRAVIVFDGQAPEGEDTQHCVVVGTGSESADDRLVELARESAEPVWLVTSDRELRRRIGDRADRVLGGGAFLSELLRT
jgi:hypothetical protein